MHLRSALAALIGLLLVPLFMSWPAADALGQEYDGPIVDAHSHLEDESGVSLDTLMSLYDQVGVRGAWVMGVPWQRATNAWERYPDRVVPFLAQGYTETLDPNGTYRNTADLEGLLAGGSVRGLGEMILRHSPFTLSTCGVRYSAPAVNVPADSPELLATYLLAGQYGVPVSVHQEAAHADELERAVRAAPQTTFVWAHGGHGPAAVVRRMLERNSNFYVDLSARSPCLGPGTMLTQADGAIHPEWAALLREYPDRFLIGLDLFVPEHYQLPYVQDMVQYYRRLLGRLDRRTAEQIAYRNAERLAPFVVP
jgi:Tat protein secretion system quality control protein TatD with DNase activity